MTEASIQNVHQYVFYNVYGKGSKDNTLAQILLKMINEYLHSEKASQACIFSDPADRKNVLRKLTRDTKQSEKDRASLLVMFLCQYGCALLMRKNKKESPIKLEILIPEQWATNAKSSQQKKLEFCDPKSYSSIHLDQCDEECTDDLQTFYQNFKVKMAQAQAHFREKQKQNQGDEPAVNPQIQTIIKYALKQVKSKHKKKNYQMKQSTLQFQQQDQIQKVGESIKFQESNGSIAWSIVQILLKKLLTQNEKKKNQNNNLKAEKLIVGFKAYTLLKITDSNIKKNKECDRKQIGKYKLCLDDLIFSYRSKISIDSKNNIEEFQSIIKKINQNIMTLCGGYLTSKISDSIKQNPQFQLQDSQKPTIKQLQRQSLQKLKPQLVKIDDFPHKVSHRLPFENLLNYMPEATQNQSIKNQWILLVQKVIFSFSEKLKIDNPNTIIDYEIHMREIQCQMGPTNICKLVLAYQKCIAQSQKSQIYYGMGLPGQARSHIELVKVIATIVAFQSVKMNRQNRNSNLIKYRIPLDIKFLFENFISHSYQARQAMNDVYKYYKLNQKKQQIFKLNDSDNTYTQIADIVGNQTRSAKVWLSNMDTIMDLEKKLKVKEVQLAVANNYVQGFKAQIISVKKYQHLPYLNQDQTFLNNASITLPIKKYQQSRKNVFAFLHNIPTDLLGLIKIIMISQNPLTNDKIVQEKQNYFAFNKLFQQKQQDISIKIFNKKIPEQYAKITAIGAADQIRFIEPSPNSKIFIQNQSKGQQYSHSTFHIYPSKSQYLNEQISYFLNTPEDQKNLEREHYLYSNMPLKPKQLQLQDFLAIGNVRSGQKTQLIVLLQNILQRKIISNSYEQTNILAEQVILQTAGLVSAFHQKAQIHFKSIQNLIKKFREVWVFSDTNFCPVFGPIFSYLMRELFYWGIVQDQQQQKQLMSQHFKLAQCCYVQFIRGQKQLRQNPNLTIYWDQRFICVATLCMFRQIKLTLAQSKEIQFLISLIFQNRICKIMSDRQDKPKNKRTFEYELEFSIEKVIYNNILAISDYLNNNPFGLTNILKRIDESTPEDIEWKRSNVYAFVGVSKQNQDTYQLDIYKGCIYKNGKEVSALDKAIKQNIYFKQIFGQDRQFQVFPSRYTNYLRTKNNLNHQFKIKQNTGEVFFEFAQNGSSLRYIIVRKEKDKKNTEEIWQLFPRQKLKQSNSFIPKLFYQNYLAWYSKQTNCIVFRRKQFEKIHQIGIVFHLQKRNDKLIISKAFLVNYNNGYEQQDLLQICNPQNSLFQIIKIRSKSKKIQQLKPYQILSRFEYHLYILQIQNQKTKTKYLWLHRHKMRFILTENKLISENHFGYEIDYSFYEDKLCLFNHFDCLVLKKTNDHQNLNLNNNQRMLIVSEGFINQGGKICKEEVYKKNDVNEEVKSQIKSNLTFDSYKYEVHDFFGDLRGSNRESQLHMAALMLSINNNIKIESIEMTPLQYAIHLMKTCVTNMPLTSKQNKQLKAVVKFSNDEVLLLSQCLYKCSQKLRNVLPFSGDKGQHCYIKRSKDQLLKCRTLYQKKSVNNHVRYLQQLPKDLLAYIGLKMEADHKTCQVQQNCSSDSSEFQSQGQNQKQSYFWKGLQQFLGDKIIQQHSNIQKLYKQFEQNCKEIRKWWNSTQDQKQITQDFPQDINKESTINKKNEMMKEMIQQLKESHHTYVNEQHKIKVLVQKLMPSQIQVKISQIQKFKELTQNCISHIQSTIQFIKKHNQAHPELISGIRPSLSPAFYTSILCQPSRIQVYYPNLKKQAAQKLKQIIKFWISLKTRRASLQRTIRLLQSKKIDVVALLRQILSPRQEVYQKSWWLCFEAQMKIQLWPSQLQTYNNLMNMDKQSKQNPFCQLNMGQGKTQTIIPMMILNMIYGQDKKLPRINILSSLFEQAKSNFFRFLSATGFQIPGFEIPFKRTVQLKKINIFLVRDLINNFKYKSFILMTRQSKLSQVLKYREISLTKNFQKITWDEFSLFNCKVFDIFDQIDAMMTPLKSYIFSIGLQIELHKGDIRQDVLRLCLEVFLISVLPIFLNNKTITSDQTIQDALKCVQNGQFPLGLRYILENTEKQDKVKIRRQIAKIVLFMSEERHYFSFVSRLDQIEKQNLIKYVTQAQQSEKLISSKIGQASRNQIYIIRGALAHGILQHCLAMRCGVQYGAPNEQHIKRIAVPYQAADIPSKTSQYQHPDVSILLSYVSYYIRGLTESQFLQTLQNLLSLTDTSRQSQYKQWIKILNEEARQELDIKLAKQININSKAMKANMYQHLKKNRRTISFWLIKCVFPKDLKQYNQSICSSAWELADVKYAVGFSGTKDNRWIFSDKLLWKPCQSPSIKGTDGKMITLITKFTNQVCLIEQSEQTLWKRFLHLALQKKVGCVIDAGAICVGKSLKNQIVPWIAQHKHFDSQKFLGVSFCDQNGKWQVYDIQSKYYISRGTTIPDNQTFVIFDQARTRGADLKMNEDIVAALSLGPNMTKDKLMQAAGRLRKLGRQQSLILMATHQVYSYIQGFSKESDQIKKKISETNKEELTNKILAWCCRNSIKQNQQLLLQFANLGWKYIYTKVKKQTYKQQIVTRLNQMYKQALETKSVAQSNRAIYGQKDQSIKQDQTSKYILEKLNKYGMRVMKEAGTLDNVCQRQIQTEKQQQKEQQDGVYQLRPIGQIQQPQLLSTLEDTPYKFNQKFKITQNFIDTTKQPINFDQKRLKQLSECYFVKYNQKTLQLISLREASMFINRYIIGAEQQAQESFKIQLLKNLRVDDEFIMQNQLQQALVNAYFVSGRQNYMRDEEQMLLKMFVESSKQQDWTDNYIDLVTIILKKRRIYLKRFFGSSLEKMIILLTNNQKSKNLGQDQ